MTAPPSFRRHVNANCLDHDVSQILALFLDGATPVRIRWWGEGAALIGVCGSSCRERHRRPRLTLPLLISSDGSALRVDVDGTTRISTTDTAFSSGAVGLWSYDASAANQHVFDDFNLVDLSQGSAPTLNLAALFTGVKTWLRDLFGGAKLAALAPVTVEARSLAVEVPAGQTWNEVK